MPRDTDCSGTVSEAVSCCSSSLTFHDNCEFIIQYTHLLYAAAQSVSQGYTFAADIASVCKIDTEVYKFKWVCVCHC